MTNLVRSMTPFLPLCSMLLLIAASFRGTLSRNFFVSASRTAESKSFHSTTSKTSAASSNKVYRTLQVQIVHRHGDRTPITPLQDEDFWSKTLVPASTLDTISSNTHLVRGDAPPNTHKAGGRGPFGKLTELGLLQMVKVGNTLREQFATDQSNHKIITGDNGDTVYPHVWTPHRPLHPSNIRVFSTDFARTIQSVQGLLVGLFPDGTGDVSIPINIQYTNMMIPDPQPRQTHEQEALERELASRPHVLEKEQDMRPLATRATKALHDYLAEDAHEVSFGVDQEHPGDMTIEIEPLAWNQLAEITKCLAVRNLLPDGITQDDQEAISRHAAWRWFENLRHPRLVHLAMNKFVRRQVEYFVNHHNEPPVTVWSAHDSTLIGLLCAFRLEQPTVWPEYASYFVMELIEVHDTDTNEKDYVVRFSLNGEQLRSNMGNDEESLDMVPLSMLAEKIREADPTETS